MENSLEIYNYLQNLHALRVDQTHQLYLELSAERRPIIKEDVATFIKQLVESHQPQKILEIGTNCGFSTICLAQYMPLNAELITLEINQENSHIAKQNFIKYLPEKKITLINDEAAKILPTLTDSFDLIFIDADKQNYQLYLDFAAQNLKTGKIVLIDNLLWKGRVAKDDPKESNSTKFLKQFNIDFVQDGRFNSSILPLGDGLGFGIKR